MIEVSLSLLSLLYVTQQGSLPTAEWRAKHMKNWLHEETNKTKSRGAPSLPCIVPTTCSMMMQIVQEKDGGVIIVWGEAVENCTYECTSFMLENNYDDS